MRGRPPLEMILVSLRSSFFNLSQIGSGISKCPNGNLMQYITFNDLKYKQVLGQTISIFLLESTK